MSDWQDIETAPKDATKVLLWNGDHVIGYFERMKEWPTSKGGFNQWTTGMETVSTYDCGFARIKQPTHWMRLPAPPEPPEPDQ